MIDCHISFPNPLTHLLQIELAFNTKAQSTIDLILPSWRPGRYELAPFVENIQEFVAAGKNGSVLKWEKTRPNIWQIETAGHEELVVRYQYFANKMDAGNSVLDERQIYVNFINCIFYTHNPENEQYNLKIDIPADFETTCSLPLVSSGKYEASDYQQLVDSPLLASPDLKILKYETNGCEFSIAILGDYPLPDDDLIKDFKKFTESQVAAMGEFPVNQYDFLVQSLDYTHYHGVEHQNSTVLVLGPNGKAHKDAYYEKLMGVASHELFHTWNVTRIRPKEMSPYQFDMETMTKTGFVTEGFTTYYGDLFLKQSGVFNQNEYFREVNTLFKRHFENYGRFESSLVQSSQNLWVDGYKNLFPSKKVSIYVKGALCSLILDLTIRKNSTNNSCLIEVVKELYKKHTYNHGGYTQQEVYDILVQVGGPHVEALLVTLYETTEDLEPYLSEALSYVGCRMRAKEHPDELTSQLGLKFIGAKISEIATGAHTENMLSVGDEILKINGKSFSVKKISLKKINQFEIKRGPRTLTIDVAIKPKIYFGTYEITVDSSASEQQLENLSLWLGNNQK